MLWEVWERGCWPRLPEACFTGSQPIYDISCYRSPFVSIWRSIHLGKFLHRSERSFAELSSSAAIINLVSPTGLKCDWHLNSCSDPASFELWILFELAKGIMSLRKLCLCQAALLRSQPLTAHPCFSRDHMLLLKLCMHTAVHTRVHLHLSFHMEKKRFYVNLIRLFLSGKKHNKLDLLGMR